MESFSRSFIQTLLNECSYNLEQNHLWPCPPCWVRRSGIAPCHELLWENGEILSIDSGIPLNTHKGRKWVTGEDSKTTVPCPSGCSILSFLSDLNFTFLYHNDVFWFLLWCHPLLCSCTPYISCVKHRDCHVSCLNTHWILLSLSERCPWASLSSCLW